MIMLFCHTCQSHNNIKYDNVKDNDCCINTCDLCNDKNCYAHGYIGDCDKCDKSLCYACCGTFWCYECENGFCYNCEELVSADGTYCKPCAVKLNL